MLAKKKSLLGAASFSLYILKIFNMNIRNIKKSERGFSTHETLRGVLVEG
jgi:hypothetical protein|tara:strand:+ start:501 stop:650 length:150 start_codon:yes stop_codon:yes gene_type:complete